MIKLKSLIKESNECPRCKGWGHIWLRAGIPNIVTNCPVCKLGEPDKTFTIYRGESTYNKNGNYYTTDKEWARQFTQSGQDKEIKQRNIKLSSIYKPNPLPQATNETEVNQAIQDAKAGKFDAVWMDEGPNEPNSIFVINKKSLMKETMLHEYFSNDTERFKSPLIAYLKKTFKEYNESQLMMFGLSVNELIAAFLHKILSIQIYYTFRKGGLPVGTYHGDGDFIDIEDIDNVKYRTTIGYAKYVDSVIFHELIHAINFHKKLWDTVTYDALVPTDKYYGDPEEIRAYGAQIKDFLVSHLGLTRKQAEKLMSKYSTDSSEYRKKWIPKYYDMIDENNKFEYPLASRKDLRSYEGMEGWKGKVVWMSPDKFLQLATPISKGDERPESCANIEHRIKNGLPLDYLVLEVNVEKRKVTSHEGRHRAMVAKKLGIAKVPVLVYTGSSFKRVPEWEPEDHALIDKVGEFKPEWQRFEEEKQSVKKEAHNKLKFQTISTDNTIQLILYVKGYKNAVDVFVTDPNHKSIMGQITLYKHYPIHDLNIMLPEDGYLLVSSIFVNVKREGYGYLLYREALRYAKSNGYKGLCSYRISRSQDSSRVWDKLKTKSDEFYDYLNIEDLGNRVKENTTNLNEGERMDWLKSKREELEKEWEELDSQGTGHARQIEIQKALLKLDSEFQKWNKIYRQLHENNKGNRIIDSPEFKRWFGNSKVVDKHGNPLVVYHGTKSVFKSFDFKNFGASDQGLVGKGFYFTSSGHEAGEYSLNVQYGKGENSNVMFCYISLQNPFVITQGVLPDGRTFRDVHPNGINSSEGGAALNKEIKDKGYDGVIFTSNTGVIKHVVAFHPIQIKSATGNTGTFNPNDPDITTENNIQETNKLLMTEASKDEAALDWLKKMVQNGPFKGNVYLAGGAVRDMEMGKTPKDLDVVVTNHGRKGGLELAIWLAKQMGNYKGPTTPPPKFPPNIKLDANDRPDYRPIKDLSPEEIAIYHTDEMEQAAQKYDSYYGLFSNPVVFPKFGTAKVVLKGDHNGINLDGFDVEAVFARKEVYTPGSRKPEVFPGTIEDDAFRRDFTVNSMMMDLTTGKVLDITGKGRADIKAGIIRSTSDPDEIFGQDALRMFRAVRFAAKYEWEIEPQTIAGIKNNLNNLGNTSKERIRDELDKILLTNHPRRGFEFLRDLGLLPHIAPEFQQAVGMIQNKYHSEDVFGHMMSVVSKTNPDLKERLLALFHDIGKVVTRSETPTGVHFYGHEDEGAKLVDRIMRELKYPLELINAVKVGVQAHMRLKSGGDDAVKLSDKALRKFKMEMGDTLESVLNLIHADNCCHAPGSEMPNQVANIRKRLAALNIELQKPKLPINGNDLLAIGIPAGPKIGQILSAITDKWFENPNVSQEEALEIAKGMV